MYSKETLNTIFPNAFSFNLFGKPFINPKNPTKYSCAVTWNALSHHIFFYVQVIGDATPTASALMKREGVRSVPSFHYFKDGEKIEVVNGANADAIEAAIKNNL